MDLLVRKSKRKMLRLLGFKKGALSKLLGEVIHQGKFIMKVLRTRAHP